MTIQPQTLDSNIDISLLPVELQQKFEQVQNDHDQKLITSQGKQHLFSALKQLYSDLISNVSASPQPNSPFDHFLQTHLSSNHSYKSRRLLDSYADSLIYVNHLYNQAFGVQSRLVPTHSAHFIDVEIMTRLQARFDMYFQKTSASQLRTGKDMQFSFSYFYFLMSETEECNVSTVVYEYDTDQSG